jgi:hypothetical protein
MKALFPSMNNSTTTFCVGDPLTATTPDSIPSDGFGLKQRPLGRHLMNR